MEEMDEVVDDIWKRLPKLTGYFEEVLAANAASDGEWFVGAGLTYVDLMAFAVIDGLGYAFPHSMARLGSDLVGLLDLHARIGGRPRIASYRASSRYLSFNEDGIFRRYEELDPPD